MKLPVIICGTISSITIYAQTTNGIPQADLEHGFETGYYVKLNGDTLYGEIYHNEVYPNYFSYRQNADSKPEKIDADSVKIIRFETGLEFVSLKGTLLTLTNTESKIKIYQRFHAPGTLKKIEGGMVEGKYEYLVVIEDKLELTNINSLNQLKPLNKKVPPLLEECPELSKKVKNKEKGYKPTLMNPTLDVWKQIAIEYENCK